MTVGHQSRNKGFIHMQVWKAGSTVACPVCKAAPRRPCLGAKRGALWLHAKRVALSEETLQAEAALIRIANGPASFNMSGSVTGRWSSGPSLQSLPAKKP
jgi:hypothetical protein